MKVGIVGNGTWGTTLGMVLAGRGQEVLLWARSPQEAQLMSAERRNTDRLPDYRFPDTLRVTSDLEEALRGADLAIFAVPSGSMRENAARAAPFLTESTLLVSASKGLEKESSRRMSQVLAEELPEALHASISVLSGPNLSKEIMDGHPASTVIASSNERAAAGARDIIMSPMLRAYTNTDVIGVELGGALKNIIAIGAGMSDGLGYGDNAKATFMTRGLVEITRLGVAVGARPLTFAGLACLGDLVATSSSRLSRNYFVGEQLAKGRPLKVILKDMRYVAEGVDTTVAALNMAGELGVEMPITEYTSKVLFEGMEPESAVKELMSRAPKPEWEGIPLS